MALNMLNFEGEFQDFNSLEVRRRTDADGKAFFTISDPDRGKSTRADGVLILEWTRKPEKAVSIAGVELFSEFEVPGAFWMAFKLKPGSRFHIEEIEKLSLDLNDAAKVRQYCLPDRERWLWTYEFPEDLVTAAQLSNMLNNELKSEHSNDQTALVVEWQQPDGSTSFHFVSKIEVISNERIDSYTRKPVCVLRPHAMNGWTAFGYPNASPPALEKPLVDSRAVRPAISKSPGIAGHEPPPPPHKPLK